MVELVRGAAYLREGARFLRRRPGLFLLGIVPAVVVFLVLGTAFVVLLLNLGDLVSWATPFLDGWADGVRRLARLLLAVAVVVGALVLASSVFVGLTLFVGEPFYDRIWQATEAALGGDLTDDGIGFTDSLRDAAVLMGSGLLTSGLVLASGFIPLVGPAVGAASGVVLSGRLLARELLARPLEARGLDREAQARLLQPVRARVLGFGTATQLCFLIPLGAVVVMPVAVVAATMLARDAVTPTEPPR